MFGEGKRDIESRWATNTNPDQSTRPAQRYSQLDIRSCGTTTIGRPCLGACGLGRPGQTLPDAALVVVIQANSVWTDLGRGHPSTLNSIPVVYSRPGFQLPHHRHWRGPPHKGVIVGGRLGPCAGVAMVAAETGVSGPATTQPSPAPRASGATAPSPTHSPGSRPHMSYDDGHASRGRLAVKALLKCRATPPAVDRTHVIATPSGAARREPRTSG